MDDDHPRTGDSLPDPDDRLWRHPSELAAGAGTAPIGRIDGGGAGVGSRAVAAIAVAAGAIYLSWYLAGSTSGQSLFNSSATQAVSATSVTAMPTTIAVGATSPESASGLSDGGETSSVKGPAAAGSPDETGPNGALSDAEASAAEVPAATPPSTLATGSLDDDLTSYSGQPVAPLLKSSNRELIEQRQVGLYEYRTGREPLARFIAHDGMLVTSASALAGRRELSVWDMNLWVVASVVAVDRISDIAVLEPENWTEHLEVLAGTVDPDPSPPGPNETVTVKPTTTLTGLRDGQAGGHTDGDPDVDRGAVIGIGERVVHRGGHAIYDGARTTIEFRSSLAGGRLLDEGDRTVGMVINGSSWSLAAMPIDSALDIARSLRTTGEAAASRIGLEAMTDNNGAVRVVWVEPDSPSAELISPGDIIETWDGEPVVDADHLVHWARRAPANRPVDIGVRRQGRQENTTLVPAPVAVND